MNNINICFSFDKNYIKQALVTIASLLRSSSAGEHYSFFLVVSQNVRPREKEIKNFILNIDNLSSVKFIYRDNFFKNGFETRGITNATYYRLLFHTLMLAIDKVIYADVDVIFNRGLKELWSFDMGKNCVAGIRASFNLKRKWKKCCDDIDYWAKEFGIEPGNYVQAGFLIMDLANIRKSKCVSLDCIAEMARKQYVYVDQDIINILFRGKIAFLPPKYNFFAPNPGAEYDLMAFERLYTYDEVQEAKYDPVMYHYAGEKPWNNPNIQYAECWWDFVKSDAFLFNMFKTKLSRRERRNVKQQMTEKQQHWWLQREFYKNLGYKLNFKNPKTLNEKIQWLKFNGTNPLMTVCSDKYLVRDFIEKEIGAEYLIPLLGAYDSPDDIDFDKLPNKFVLKVNWGSGQNIIVKDKSQANIFEIKGKLRTWMKPWKNHYYHGFEWCYKNVKPKIICEKYIEQMDGKLYDYKIFCSNAEPKFLFVGIDRSIDLRFNFYDMNWNKLPFKQHYDVSDKTILPPQNFKEMVRLSKKLSRFFNFVRCDFFEIDGKVYFGELTFYHFNGMEKFEPAEWDLKLGQLISLPKRKGLLSFFQK